MLTADDMLTEEEYVNGTRATRTPHPLCAMLRGLRHAKGLSLQQVEDRFNISAVVLGAYERGDREPPLRKLDKVLHIFGYKLVAEPISADAVRPVNDIVAHLRAIADQLEENA